MAYNRCLWVVVRLPWWLSSKESACNAGDTGWNPGSGRSPGGGHGNLLQYSCLENPMDRGACGLQSMGWWRVRYSWTHRHTQVVLIFLLSLESNQTTFILLFMKRNLTTNCKGWENPVNFAIQKILKIKLKEASHLKAFDWKQFLSLKIIIGLLHFEANLALMYRFPPKLSLS